MDECIGSIGDTTIVSTLDANSGYLQAEVAGGDCDKQLLHLIMYYSGSIDCYLV